MDAILNELKKVLTLAKNSYELWQEKLKEVESQAQKYAGLLKGLEIREAAVAEIESAEEILSQARILQSQNAEAKEKQDKEHDQKMEKVKNYEAEVKLREEKVTRTEDGQKKERENLDRDWAECRKEQKELNDSKKFFQKMKEFNNA